ncbi:MAG: hypothetical protein RL685_4807 [Pseudomonadota bacterium]
MAEHVAEREASLDPGFEASSPGGVEGRVFWRETRALAAVLLPGLYAWGATVAWPAFATRGASSPARIGAVGALVALLLGLGLARRYPVLGRAIGVLGCLGCAAISWGALGNVLRVPPLDPVRAALGALAWGLFAQGWGAFHGPHATPPAEPAFGARLPSRGRLPISTRLGFGLLVCVAVGLPLLAWRVERPGVALLAQAVALAASVGLLNVGTRVLVLRPNLVRRAPWLGLVLCAVWLISGVLLWLL